MNNITKVLVLTDSVGKIQIIFESCQVYSLDLIHSHFYSEKISFNLRSRGLLYPNEANSHFVRETLVEVKWCHYFPY